MPTPDFEIVTTSAESAAVALPLPLFVKPVAEGTSKGVTAASVVTSRAALVDVCTDLLQDYRQPVLVERYLAGREFTVGVLGTGGGARALATLEVVLRDGADQGVYSFRNKAQWRELVDYRLARGGCVADARSRTSRLRPGALWVAETPGASTCGSTTSVARRCSR